MFLGGFEGWGMCRVGDESKKRCPAAWLPATWAPDMLMRWEPFCLLPSIAFAQP